MLKKILVLALVLCAIFCAMSCNNGGGFTQTPDWLLGKWVNELSDIYKLEFDETSFTELGVKMSYSVPGLKTQVENGKFIIKLESEGITAFTKTFTKDGNNIKYNDGITTDTYVRQ